jgi:hypothetical protein
MISFVCLHHPHLDDIFLFLTTTKAKEFIEKNGELWEKHNIDPDIFIIENAFIGDEKLNMILEECMPSLYL